MTKIWISLMFLSFLVFFSGCSEKNKFQVDELTRRGNGCYILENDTCTELISPIVHSNSMNVYNKLMEGEQSLLFLTGDTVEIPLLTSRSLLINKSSRELTEKIPIIPLLDPYYTIGICLEKSSSGKYYQIVSPDGLLEGSSARKEIGSSTGLNNDISIQFIAGIPVEENLLNNDGFIKNLEESRLYTISSVQGSTQKRYIVSADTRILKTRLTLYYIAEKQFTDKGYVILGLPEEMESGYYYLPDGSITGRGGIFYYKKI